MSSSSYPGMLSLSFIDVVLFVCTSGGVLNWLTSPGFIVCIQSCSQLDVSVLSGGDPHTTSVCTSFSDTFTSYSSASCRCISLLMRTVTSDSSEARWKPLPSRIMRFSIDVGAVVGVSVTSGTFPVVYLQGLS